MLTSLPPLPWPGRRPPARHATLYTMVFPIFPGLLVSRQCTRPRTDTLSRRIPSRRQNFIHERMVPELEHVRLPRKFLAVFLGLAGASPL